MMKMADFEDEQSSFGAHESKYATMNSSDSDMLKGLKNSVQELAGMDQVLISL